MSGPVNSVDAPPGESGPAVATAACVEITDDREAMIGGLPVRRALPQRGRRTVGPWCFEDHMGPTTVTETSGVDIAPHPHTGLHTVTWLVSGEILHRDSLGSEQVIRPGQLNLMTAGHGVAHSEEHTGSYRGQLHGVQLWLAQPEGTRHGPAAFEHHAQLPVIELGRSVATLLVGEFAGAASAARQDVPTFGVDGVLAAGRTTWPARPDFEYGLAVIEGSVSLPAGLPAASAESGGGAGDAAVRPGQFAYLGMGRDELVVDAPETARILVIGGRPSEEPVLMWWNFVARTWDEIEQARTQWEAGDPRFGPVRSELPRIPAPELLWPHR